ncbi:MAG: hypothetical protein QM652_02415 [Legionella sp.]|uniref:hypothetical protein n=1 Tax=Legionella sp. TaxID=459 RepID=UPI0039E31D3C
MLHRFNPIVLIDDNPHTAHLILRLFLHLEHDITYVTTQEELDLNTTPYHLMFINLACLPQNQSLIRHCMDWVPDEIPVISYFPRILLNDFKCTKQRFSTCIDDGWMLHSQLVQWLKRVTHIPS